MRRKRPEMDVPEMVDGAGVLSIELGNGGWIGPGDREMPLLERLHFEGSVGIQVLNDAQQKVQFGVNGKENHDIFWLVGVMHLPGLHWLREHGTRLVMMRDRGCLWPRGREGVAVFDRPNFGVNHLGALRPKGIEGVAAIGGFRGFPFVMREGGRRHSNSLTWSESSGDRNEQGLRLRGIGVSAVPIVDEGAEEEDRANCEQAVEGE